MRDFFVHDYQSMDKEVIWDTVVNGIPDLFKKCKALLKEYHKNKNVSQR